MDDLLTLPGSIPGLLRRGSPVLYRNDALKATGWGNVLPTPEEDECGGILTFWAGAINAPENPGQRMLDALAAGMGANPGRGVYCVPTFLLALDLSEATGRAHAAWWLAHYFVAADGPPSPGRHMQPTSALWSFDGGSWILALLAVPEVHMHGHRLTPAGAAETFVFPAHGRERSEYGVPLPWHWSAVPTLAALDPNDPRLLPDGSRLVDALALRLVCQHVAGLGVPRG